MTKRKYLKDRPVIDWIRPIKKIQKGISNILDSVLQYFHVLNDWLVGNYAMGFKQEWVKFH